MNNINELLNNELVDEIVALDNEMKEKKQQLDTLKAEIQRRGLEHLDDKQLKTVQFLGTNNNYVLVQKSEKLDMLNFNTIKDVLRGVTSNYIEVTTETKYSFKKTLKDGLTSIFTNNYEERSVKDILIELGLTGSILELAIKKLKGNWVKDKAFLESLELDESKDIEIYLFFIHQAINYEKLTTILESVGYEELDKSSLLEKLRKAIVVGESIKITING